MKKQFLMAAVVVFLALPAAVHAQESGTFQLISFDIGYAPTWEFQGSNSVFLPSFALNIRVADGFTTGFQSYTIASGAVSLLNMKYDFIPSKVRGVLAIGADELFFGSGGTSVTVAGLGFEYIPFTKNVAGSVTTEFKIGLQYLFDTTDVTKGVILFNLAFGIGV
jgi:hypothetical protein